MTARSDRLRFDRRLVCDALRTPIRGEALILDAAAAGLAARIERWSNGGDAEELAGWVGSLCRRFSNVAELRQLFLAAPDIVTAVVGSAGVDGEGAGAATELRALIAGAVEASWRTFDSDASGRLDEVDARIDELVVTLEAADATTAEHSRAVGSWSARIARRLGLGPDDVVFARRAGLLHDIGKLRVPADVLNAPRSLTVDEWVVVRAHAIEGVRIVRADPILAAFAPPIHGHHERIDGHGYPDGIRATALPLTTRIVSVADSFNAMIGNRPYRRPLRPTDAVDELRRFRGRQFDPDVVEALLSVVID